MKRKGFIVTPVSPERYPRLVTCSPSKVAGCQSRTLGQVLGGERREEQSGVWYIGKEEEESVEVATEWSPLWEQFTTTVSTSVFTGSYRQQQWAGQGV